MSTVKKFWFQVRQLSQKFWFIPALFTRDRGNQVVLRAFVSRHSVRKEVDSLTGDHSWHQLSRFTRGQPSKNQIRMRVQASTALDGNQPPPCHPLTQGGFFDAHF